MLNPKSQTVSDPGIDLLCSKSTRENQEIAARLETIYEQIKNYPTPIAGCDEQFNFLLEELDRLRNLLATEGNGSVTVE